MQQLLENRSDPGRLGPDGFEVAIVGGGALGSALAWEAASRGLSTVVLEKNDIGTETSANSLEIIHGGLRYLQSLNLSRTRASARERAILFRIAPHLVSPLLCVCPTTRSLKRGRLAFAAAISANRILGIGLSQGDRRSRKLGSGGIMTARKLAQLAPGISMSGVTGAAFWYDARMYSGERLALAFAQSAARAGAVVLTHVEALKAACVDQESVGLQAKDALTGDVVELQAQCVLDCRGVGLVRQSELFGDLDVDIDFVKAANVILEKQDAECAVGAPERDVDGDPKKRLLFARPTGNGTAVGTWYFPYESGSERVSDEELESMLLEINRSFPGWQVTDAHVRGVQLGFLPRQSHRERIDPIDKPIVMESSSVGGPDRVWHLQTEKWTTVRALAESVISMLSARRILRASPSRTHATPLCGGEPYTLSQTHRALLSSLGEAQASRLSRHYGANLAAVLELATKRPELAESLPFAQDVLVAELPYVIGREFPRSIEDLWRRLAVADTGSSSSQSLPNLREFLDQNRESLDVSDLVS